MAVPSQKIIIYNAGAIGDLLVSMAAVHDISLLFPNSEQTLLGNSLWKSILLPSQWPQISTFVECERKSLKNLILYKANRATDTWEKVESISSLTEFLKNFSIGICLRNRSLRFVLALIKAKVKMRVGSHKDWWARLLYTHFSQESRIRVHERERHLNVLSSVDENFVKKQKEYWSLHGLPPLKKSYDTKKFKEKFGNDFIVINPTSSIREKAWNAQNFKAVVDALVSENKKVVVLGAPNETEWLKEVATNKAPIYQATSIYDVCDLIASTSLLLTNTSSLQFIAATTGTLTVTLMGCANPVIWRPLGKNDILICAESRPEDEKIQNDPFLNKTERGKKLETITYARIPIKQVLDTLHEISIKRN